MPEYSVHHLRCFQPVPIAANCLAYDSQSDRIALSRQDGSIEFYRGSSARFIFDCQIPAASPRSIECLALFRGRLFSSGLDGKICEYSMERLTMVNEITIGNPVWTLAVNDDLSAMACGSENGDIAFIQLEEDVTGEACLVVASAPIRHSSGRVLSLVWLAPVGTEHYLASSGIGFVHVWNASRRSMLWHVAVEGNRGDPAIVWAIAACGESVLAAGDSRGVVTLFDVDNGTIISEVSSHSNDVFALAVPPMQTNYSNHAVFAVGADPTVVRVAPISSTSSKSLDSWISTNIHRQHTHQVRAACFISPNLLATVGVDRNLVICDVSRGDRKGAFSVVDKISPLSPSGFTISAGVSSSSQIYVAMAQSGKNGVVEIFRLSSKDTCEKELLVRIKPTADMPGGPHLVRLSPNAQKLALAFHSTIRLFDLDFDLELSEQERSSMPRASRTGALKSESLVTDMAFDENSTLFAVTADAKLLTSTGSKFDFKADFEDLPALFLRVVDDVLAIATRSSVQLYRVSPSAEKPFVFVERFGKVLRYDAGLLTALALKQASSVEGPVALMAYSDRRIAEYDCSKGTYTKWTRTVAKLTDENAFPAEWLSYRDTITWIGYAPKSAESTIITSGGRLLASIKKDTPIPMKLAETLHANQKNQINRGDRYAQTEGDVGIRGSYAFNHVIYFDSVGDDFVLVQVMPDTLTEQLPPIVVTKKAYGT